MVREEGVQSLFRGMGARLLWITAGGCIFFSTLELTENMLVRQRRERYLKLKEEKENAQKQIHAIQSVHVAET